MPKVKISEYSATANSNTDVASINIDEGCAPSGINNAIRAVMGHLKDFQQGTYGDPFNGPVNGTLGATTASTANVTTLTTSSTVTHNGGTAYGVAYLNGSKVLTTGSALVFDGTNLGLGVTPSAWQSGLRAFQFGATASIYSNGSNTTFYGLNFYTDSGGTNRYLTSNIASAYGQVSGAHQWYTAASGTAGNAITFTQAMTLDASGNLMVGVTSALGKFSVLQGATSNGDTVVVKAATASGAGSQPGIKFLSNADANLAQIIADVNTSALVINMGGSAAARIDSSGNLLVGTTSAGTGFQNGLTVNASNASSTSTYLAIGHANGVASGNSYMAFLYDGGVIGSITQSGTSAVLFNVTSDQRLKENIQDADSASSLIDSLQVRKFDWKTDQTHQRYGFIAQELVTVAPEAVHAPADPDEMMAVDYSKLVPMLVKEIQSLRKRLAAAGI
jgi:hypothetical protein